MSWYNPILKRIAKAAFKVEKTDKATASKRFSICQECPNFNEKELKCMICGCFMEVKTELKVHTNYFKKRNEITHCPEGRWGLKDKEIANYYRGIDGLELIK